MNILYIGDKNPSTGSSQRARAFERLGHVVTRIDLERELLRSRLSVIGHYRTGYRFLQRRAENWLACQLSGHRFDLAWVDSGAVVGRHAVELLRRHAGRVVNYNCDDPTGSRDPGRWHSFRKAIPAYDALIVVRDESAREYRQSGARKVVQVMRSYDELDLAPRSLTPAEQQQWASKVLFAGTWMPERGPFLAKLIEQGVPLTIYGDRWEKAPQWKILKGAYRGPALEGPNYVAAMMGTKIALGLLSKGNRDLHTIRSSEVPYMGVLFCAERTREHAAMYEEGKEAVFWSTAEECSRICHKLLADDFQRQKIAIAGREKVLRLRLNHTQVITSILTELASVTRAEQNSLLMQK